MPHGVGEDASWGPNADVFQRHANSLICWGMIYTEDVFHTMLPLWHCHGRGGTAVSERTKKLCVENTKGWTDSDGKSASGHLRCLEITSLSIRFWREGSPHSEKAAVRICPVEGSESQVLLETRSALTKNPSTHYLLRVFKFNSSTAFTDTWNYRQDRSARKCRQCCARSDPGAWSRSPE